MAGGPSGHVISRQVAVRHSATHPTGDPDDMPLESFPRFLRGIFPFTGSGFEKAIPVDGLTYTVPSHRRSQLIYFRGGNSSGELICLTLLCDGKPFRLFPIGAKDTIHVSLAVVEDLSPEAKLDVLVSAPAGASGELVLDIGLLEI
jgi:hypothetical protein